MILAAATLSFRNLFQRGTRIAFFKILGVTILVLLALWQILAQLFVSFLWPVILQVIPSPADYPAWLMTLVSILANLGLIMGLALLLAPVTAMVAGLFLDEVAEIIEKRDYPADRPGQSLSIRESVIQTLQFFGVVILGNMVALLLLLVPGINLIAFFVVNGYLLGREFFEFAAMRLRPKAEALAYRRKHRVTVFLAGLLIALFLAVPFVNLLTPLFAAGLMVHLHKALSRRDGLSVDHLRR